MVTFDVFLTAEYKSLRSYWKFSLRDFKMAWHHLRKNIDPFKPYTSLLWLGVKYVACLIYNMYYVTVNVMNDLYKMNIIQTN